MTRPCRASSAIWFRAGSKFPLRSGSLRSIHPPETRKQARNPLHAKAVMHHYLRQPCCKPRVEHSMSRCSSGRTITTTEHGGDDGIRRSRDRVPDRGGSVTFKASAYQ